MSIKERLEDAADRLDDLALSEMLREAIEAIDEAEAEALEHELHADRVEAELVTANRRFEEMQRSRDALRLLGGAALEEVDEFRCQAGRMPQSMRDALAAAESAA